MQIRSLSATFGRLEQKALEFPPGLVLIEAPNEAGKSTLCAFLRAMLFGLPTRERGVTADKNLYAPWSGRSMQGQLVLVREDGSSVTLTRDTVRAGAPMGHFSATYTGTGEAVPDLAADSCGETLTGVSREVYENSAFIRQSALTVTPSADLERRIAALITTGEEGAPYREAEAALRKQLNARRHNKTGRIPALQAEIAALEHTTAALRTAEAELHEAEAGLADSSSQADALRDALKRHEQADAFARRSAAAEAQSAWQLADAEAEGFYRRLRASGIPEQETLQQSRARLNALSPMQAALDSAQRRCADAQQALDTFSSASHGKRTLLYIVSALASAAAGLGLLFAPALSVSPPRIASTVPFLASLCFLLCAGRARQKEHAREAEHTALVQSLHSAQAAADAQQALVRSAVQDLLSPLGLTELSQAEAFIQEGLDRWEQFAALTNRAHTAQVRCEALSQYGSAGDVPAAPVERPAQSRAALQEALAACEARMREAQRRIDYTTGRIRALGSLSDTESALAEKRDACASLEEEYDALTLSLDALARANAALQSRFAPSLGRRAAGLFRRLTGGKYSAVLLDRNFSAAAEACGDPVAREAFSLSQGTADQLYLAVRLAICELVLPADRAVPLVLDDALTSFDDERCRTALELLLELSRDRQILLFTCQHREAQFLSGRAGVHVLTL